MPPANDLSIYERHAAEWWNPRSSAFRSLHRVNAFRVALLEEWLPADLTGLVVVDLGCGGGLLSEPCARRGARTIGFDLGRASLRSATEHVGPRFACADLLHVPLADACADVVLLADVLEHVGDVDAAIAEAARIARPSGLVYVNTINRTRRARLLAVGVAETLGLVPRGTHDADLFVSPDTLQQASRRCGLALERLQGESVELLATVRRWAVSLRRSADVSVGYSALLRKAVPR